MCSSDRDRAVGVDRDAGALVGADAGALDVGAEAEPDGAALGAGGGDLGLGSFEVELLEQGGEAFRIVARVVDGRAAVLERDADVVRELLHEVAPAHVERVEVQLLRHALDHALHDVRGVGAARAAER